MKACNSCGKCCIKYSSGQLSASQQDLEMWHSFRPEISGYVVNGLIWFDPSTQKLMDYCPWLKKDSASDRYLCEIYYDRPQDCKTYPATVLEMISDGCEMIEPDDLKNLKQAQIKLNAIMVSER